MGTTTTPNPNPPLPLLLEIKTNPNKNDVLLGRGGYANSHSGNIFFRMLIRENKKKYMVASTSKAHKNSLAETIFKKISTMVPKGRFLIASGAGADAGAVAGGAGTSVAAKISASASTVHNSATIIPAAAAASI